VLVSTSIVLPVSSSTLCSTVISVSVVPQAYLTNGYVLSSPILHMAVPRSSGSVAIRHVLPVIWMTPYLHMKAVNELTDTNSITNVIAGNS